MTEHEVVIAGGGPTGLMLAGELALAGVDVAVVERRADQDLVGSRSRGLQSRTIEVLDMRGIADRFLKAGFTAQVVGFGMNRLDISDFPTRHPYGLGLSQNEFERILAGWIDELPVTMYRRREVTGFTQDKDAVKVQSSDGEPVRAQYLVGCDGGRSVVRKAAGIAFAGWDPTMSWLIAEVQVDEEPPLGFRNDAIGIHATSKLDYGGIGMVLTEKELCTGVEPTLDDLKAALVAVYGTDFGAHDPRFISRFTDMTRQAAAYRAGRVLVAGDAAHVHPPMGGQGLSLGVQDAVNLGWKLAQVVRNISPDSLLDTYHAERHPVGARVLRNTMAEVALRRRDDRTKALGEIVSELLALDEPRRRLAAELSGLGVHYDLGPGHPLLGRRMPDLDLLTGDGPARVFTFLHRARPVLLHLGTPGGIDLASWSGRVQLVEASYNGSWELPAIGKVDAPKAVLVRPDGYVAWVGEGTSGGLTEALTIWFGPA